MPWSTDVSLPRAYTPAFPDRCVACGRPGPDSTYTTATRSIGWWSVLPGWFGARVEATAPACEPCRLAMTRQRRVRQAVNAVCILAGAGAAVWLLGWYRGPGRKVLLTGAVLVLLTPLMVWELLNPRPFDLTAYAETVDYEFRDPAYAAEFAALNRTEAG